MTRWALLLWAAIFGLCLQAVVVAIGIAQTGLQPPWDQLTPAAAGHWIGEMLPLPILFVAGMALVNLFGIIGDFRKSRHRR